MKRTTKMTEQIGVRIKSDLLARVDAWRLKLKPVPSQSAAIRQLIEDGLDSHETAEKGEKPAKARK
jgi:metal-responsive CopG/Arc/MetJ family transcriptional regulator